MTTESDPRGYRRTAEALRQTQIDLALCQGEVMDLEAQVAALRDAGEGLITYLHLTPRSKDAVALTNWRKVAGEQP